MAVIEHRQFPPTAEESEMARHSSKLLSRYVPRKTPLTLRVIEEDQQEPIQLPAGAVALLMNILGAMAAGQGVTIFPENAELTTVQAAELLNVSRPYLIQLLDQKAIPHRKVGKHRRIRLEDVIAYKRAIDEEREKVLDLLVAEAQEQNMGYAL